MKKQYIKPPFFSTEFSSKGENAKKRFENILSGKAKRFGAAFILAMLCATVVMGAMVACDKKAPEPVQNTPEDEATVQPLNLDGAISAALLETNSGHYADAEFWAEGHIILGNEAETDAETKRTIKEKVYAVTSYGGYSFMNGMFIKGSGTGAIPAVITVIPSEDGSYSVEEIKYPSDGSLYDQSLREMFPLSVYMDITSGLSAYYDKLTKQERDQAQAYLNSIGREAEIGSYRDLNAVLPDMNTEASNSVLELQKDPQLANFPMYIGNIEKLEDGKRYIYTTDWDGNESGGELTFTKTDEDGKVIQKTVIEAKGENITVKDDILHLQ